MWVVHGLTSGCSAIFGVSKEVLGIEHEGVLWEKSSRTKIIQIIGINKLLLQNFWPIDMVIQNKDAIELSALFQLTSLWRHSPGAIHARTTVHGAKKWLAIRTQTTISRSIFCVFGVNKKSTKNILKCQKKCYNNMFLRAINCLGVRRALPKPVSGAMDWKTANVDSWLRRHQQTALNRSRGFRGAKSDSHFLSRCTSFEKYFYNSFFPHVPATLNFMSSRAGGEKMLI